MPNKPTFFARYSLLILVVIFFCVPFAVRGARMAAQGMKNDVKDWLPDNFPETTELDWFRRHFLGEQFVIVSWDGCRGDEQDERFKLFVAKLNPETPPSIVAAEEKARAEAAAAPSAAPEDEENGKDVVGQATRYISRDDFIGDELGLYSNGDYHFNWGGGREKWLAGFDNRWYYITPEGDLYAWKGVDSPIASAWRELSRWLWGPSLEGQMVAVLGPVDGPWYYQDPRRLRAQLFKTVTTGPDVLTSMIREGGVLADDPEEAERRLRGSLFGPDGKQTCLILTLSDAARRDLHQVIGRGLLGKPRGRLYEIGQECNIAESQLRFGGPPVDNVAIDEEGTITLFRLVGLCALVGVTLSLVCFRSVTVTIMLFFIGGICAIMSLAGVYWFGSTVDAIVMSMPALVYVLGMSGAAHIINYYHEAVAEHGYTGASETAIRHGWKPALFCNVTTAIGLVSLCTSDIVPIRKFGVFSALGVLGTLIILFTYLPAALYIWPQKNRRSAAARDEAPWLDRYLGGFWQQLGNFCIQHHAFVSIFWVLLIAGVGYGVTKIQTSVNLLKMFHSEAKIIKDYEWLETHLGQLVPMEVVVRVAPDAQRESNSQLASRRTDLEQQLEETTNADRQRELRRQLKQLDAPLPFQMPFLERMELAARVQRVVEEEFGPQARDKVGQAMTAATFAPPLPRQRGGTTNLSRRGATSGRLEAHREEFLHSDYLRIDQQDQAELWRVSLRLAATKGVDYGAFVRDLQKAIEPITAAHRERERILRTLTAQRDREHFRQTLDGALQALPDQPRQQVVRSLDEQLADVLRERDLDELYLALDEELRYLADDEELGAAVRGLDRQAVLDQFLEDFAWQNASGARVALLGVGPTTLAAADEESTGVAETESAAAEGDAAVDQTRIFVRALYDLLSVANVRLSLQGPNEQGELPDDWRAALADQDCLVLVSGRGYDAAALADLQPLVDVQDHEFVPGVSAARDKGIYDGSQVSAVYTGVVPIVYKAQRTLLDSLIESTFWSFVTITPLMMFISRSLSAGMVAMLPNVLPVLVVFGAMGWLGIEVDVGSMMTASIALGVAVDDTIHFLNWYREELDRLGDRKKAILAAYRHCATPTFQAAVISGVGLSIFALSTFTPTERFGYLMLTILWAGVVAELMFFPALLAGPLGLVFKPRKAPKKSAPPPPPAAEPEEELETEPAAAAEAEASGAVPPPAGSGKSAALRILRHDKSH